MAEQFKFSMNIKPRVRDQFLGTGIVLMSVLLEWEADAAAAYN